MSTACSAPAAAGSSLRSLGGIAALLATACAPVATGAPRPVDLAGADWRVVAVNGRITPAGGDNYSMSFKSGQLGARFGCNHMGGQYRITGGRLIVSNVSQTLMGCPEPASTFEQQGGAILGRPMRIAESTGGRVTLLNEAGSIALERR